MSNSPIESKRHESFHETFMMNVIMGVSPLTKDPEESQLGDLARCQYSVLQTGSWTIHSLTWNEMTYNAVQNILNDLVTWNNAL